MEREKCDELRLYVGDLRQWVFIEGDVGKVCIHLQERIEKLEERIQSLEFGTREVYE